MNTSSSSSSAWALGFGCCGSCAALACGSCRLTQAFMVKQEQSSSGSSSCHSRQLLRCELLLAPLPNDKRWLGGKTIGGVLSD